MPGINLSKIPRSVSRSVTRGLSKRFRKRGIFYTIDALLASMLLVAAVLMIFYAYHQNESSIDERNFISEDILNALSTIKISEVNNSFIAQEYANGNITDMNNTIIDQIGEYWALNETSKAKSLFDSVVNSSLPKDIGARVTLDDELISETNVSSMKDSVVFNRMISGIAQGKPITGSSGTSYLKKIRNKKTSSYSYFGGFVGEGNVTVQLQMLSDFNSSRLEDIYLKAEIPGTFILKINNQQCGGSYSGSSGSVSVWDISSCNASLTSGTNNINLIFTSSLNTSYVSGGFFRAVYTTDTLIENTTPGYFRYYFPDVRGFINFYDTISVQGNIVNWTLNLSFFNPYQTFFTFGNETLFITSGNNSVNQTVIYTRTNQLLAQSPIPIRIAVTNFSNITTTIYGLPADTFIVTDTSGSMADCIGTALSCSYLYEKVKNGPYLPESCTVYDASSCNKNPDNPCGGAPFYKGKTYSTSCNSSKIQVAINADNSFVDTIFAASLLHRVGLVDFDTSANSITPLTNNAVTLHNKINSYSPGGSTCTCCGINAARNNLTVSGNKKFMIVLSDGDANICCKNLNDTVGTGSSSGCTGGAKDPLNWSILAGQTACQNNITVFTIGFGTDMSASGIDTLRKTACNTSLYYNATDTAGLQAVFNNISQQILIAANFSSQTVTVQGNFSPSKLYGTSYIDVNYIPVQDASEQGKISIISETSQFGSCNASIFIPPGVSVQDAYVTSYSSNHWTEYLSVNNISVFNLTSYGINYALLGDPFIIQVPSITLQPGAYNNISLVVGDSPTNLSACSPNNTLIYTALINVSTSRTDALSNVVGCMWTIKSSSGSTFNMTIPQSYVGSRTCSYNGNNITYDPNDVYDVSVYNMLKQLDYSNTGQIFFDLNQNDLEIILLTTGQVQYMWGPSVLKMEVWK